jgi:transposase-like protein
MNPRPTPNSYKRHRFPAEIISHCVWLYFRFCLSYRDVEELMAERGITLTYEAVRYLCRKFGQTYANQLRHRRPKPGDKWHLDEVFLTINGERHYLWRAMDQDGHVLDILVQQRRDKEAAKKFFRKLLKGLTYVPRVIVTDQLKSYGVAMRELLPSVEHPPTPVPEQSRRKFSPADAPARAVHGTIQVPRARATLSRSLWPDRVALPPQTPPPSSPRIPPGDDATIPDVASHHRHDPGRIRSAVSHSHFCTR